MYHHGKEFRIAKMAEVLKVTVGGYYAWLKRLNREDNSGKIKVKEMVRKVYLESNCVYGSRKISRVLKRSYGMNVNRKKVVEIMRKEEIFSKANK